MARNLKYDVKSTNRIRYCYYGVDSDALSYMRTRAKTATNFGDAGGFQLYATMRNVKKGASNTLGNVNGFSDIEDYMVNLGVYQDTVQEITITLSTLGNYSYDSIGVLAVPLATYEDYVGTCVNNAYDVSLFADNYVTGTVDVASDSSVLYCSTPYILAGRLMLLGKR